MPTAKANLVKLILLALSIEGLSPNGLVIEQSQAGILGASFPYTDPQFAIEDAKYTNLANAQQFASVGLLSIDGYWCSGTLINEWTVLTAKHCIKNFAPKGDNWFGLGASANNLSSRHRVINVYPHPMLLNDLALVGLKEAVTNVRPAMLYGHEDEVGKEITIVGYGQTGTPVNEAEPGTQGTKRAGTNIVSGTAYAELLDSMTPTRKMLEYVFDNPTSGKATQLEYAHAPGDSGGPVFIQYAGQWWVAGTMVDQVAGKVVPLKFGAELRTTRISQYLHWINETTKQVALYRASQLSPPSPTPPLGRADKGPGGHLLAHSKQQGFSVYGEPDERKWCRTDLEITILVAPDGEVLRTGVEAALPRIGGALEQKCPVARRANVSVVRSDQPQAQLSQLTISKATGWKAEPRGLAVPFAPSAVEKKDPKTLVGRGAAGTEASPTCAQYAEPAPILPSDEQIPPAQPALGQGLLTGRIIDNFGKPVPMARVAIQGTTLASSTDAEGRYALPYPPGKLRVVASRSGHDPTEFDLELHGASTYPVEDKQLLRHPAKAGVYFQDKDNWSPLAQCRVVQTSKDRLEIMEAGEDRYVARGTPCAVFAEDAPAFLDWRNEQGGLALFRVREGGTIVSRKRASGFPGVFTVLERDEGDQGAVAIGKRAVGKSRPLYSGQLAPGTYAFVSSVWVPFHGTTPTDQCFIFELKASGQPEDERKDEASGDGLDVREDVAGQLTGQGHARADKASVAGDIGLRLDHNDRQRVQSVLNALGFQSGKPDGEFGPRTREAIVAYQRASGHMVTGYLEDAEYQQLLRAGAHALARRAAEEIASRMVAIRGGCFLMGSPASEVGRSSDERQHHVCVEDFRIGKHEVTIGEFRRFVDATGYRTDAERNAGGMVGCRSFGRSDGVWAPQSSAYWRQPNGHIELFESHPVSCVSHPDAEAFVMWLNEASGQRYRLPTEAEWEYAARAGSTTPWFWGNNPKDACSYANAADRTELGGRFAGFPGANDCTDGHFFTSPVASFRPNPWGLFDMVGNVNEMTCSAGGNPDYGGDELRCASPSTPGRAARGGNFGTKWRDLRSASRWSRDPTDFHGREATTGFRLAQDGIQ